MGVINLGRVLPMFLGDYDNARDYERMDIVYYNGSTWVATGNSVGSAPSSENEDWFLVAKGFVWKGNWNASTAYKTNDIVSHNGVAWITVKDNTGVEPTDTSDSWDAFCSGGGGGSTEYFFDRGLSIDDTNTVKSDFWIEGSRQEGFRGVFKNPMVGNDTAYIKLLDENTTKNVEMRVVYNDGTEGYFNIYVRNDD